MSSKYFEIRPDGYHEITSVPCGNSAFLLGEAAFETMRVSRGKILREAGHAGRLDQGCRELELSRPNWEAIRELVDREASADAIARLQVCRADMSGGFGLRAERDLVTLSLRPAPPPPSYLHATVVDFPRRASRSLTCRFKTSSYIDQLAVRREAVRQGADIGLMLNEAGRVACFDLASVVCVDLQTNTAWTPCEPEGPLPGVTLAALGSFFHRLVRQPIELEFLRRQDAVYAVNAGMGATPVVFDSDASVAQVNRLADTMNQFLGQVAEDNV